MGLDEEDVRMNTSVFVILPCTEEMLNEWDNTCIHMYFY